MTDDLIAKLSAPAFAPEARPPAAETPVMLGLPCTGCVIDAKQAVLLGKTPAEIPEPLPGALMVNGMLLCDIRHTLNVGTPSLLVAQPGQMPGGTFG